MKLATLVALVSSLASGAVGTITLPPAASFRQFDGFIYALADSALCDTCVSQDICGVTHRVYADSGRICYQHNEAWALRGGRKWSPVIRLSRSRTGSSPIVYELRRPGAEPTLVVMWREEAEGRIEVLCRFHQPGMLPMLWRPPLVVTLRHD